MPQSTPAPRTAIIEGRKVEVVDRTPPLPKRLDVLLSQLFTVTTSEDIAITGASAACEQWRTHRLQVIRIGKLVCTDRIIRDLHVSMCTDCGAVCVRDVSFDRIDGLTVGRGGAARRNHVLGWYSGARRGSRQYQ